MSWRAVILEATYQTKQEVLMSIRLQWIAIIVMIGIVMAVADANWPAHMGPQNALADALLSLLP